MQGLKCPVGIEDQRQEKQIPLVGRARRVEDIAVPEKSRIPAHNRRDKGGVVFVCGVLRGCDVRQLPEQSRVGSSSEARTHRQGEDVAIALRSTPSAIKPTCAYAIAPSASPNSGTSWAWDDEAASGSRATRDRRRVHVRHRCCCHSRSSIRRRCRSRSSNRCSLGSSLSRALRLRGRCLLLHLGDACVVQRGEHFVDNSPLFVAETLAAGAAPLRLELVAVGYDTPNADHEAKQTQKTDDAQERDAFEPKSPEKSA